MKSIGLLKFKKIIQMKLINFQFSLNEVSFFLLFLLLFLSGCYYDKPVVVTPVQTCNNIPEIVSFKNIIVPIFNTNCSTSGCHSGSSPKGNLNLEAPVAYMQLTRRGSGYTDTINPANSILYNSLSSNSNLMPPSGMLDACSIEMVRKWMQQKTKNN
jgi:hypothetical protein